MFRKMPFILMLVIVMSLLLNHFISLEVKQALYAISLTVKSLIISVLPLIIFGLLFKTMLGLAQRATMVIMLILLCVCLSNTLSTFLSHFMGSWIYQLDLTIIQPKNSHTLVPTWSWSFPQWMANDKAMFLGIALGILFGRMKTTVAERLATKLDWLISKMLASFSYLIVLFVIGFVVKLEYDGVIHTIIKDYTFIFALIVLAQFSYIFFAYAALNRFNIAATLRCIKNILPAALAGFSTMSSAAVMPLTIAGAKNNAQDKTLAQSIIPATVNIHLVGDCFAIPILAYAVMKSFGVAEPSLLSYVIFMFYFVIAKFSVAAIPGGGIVVMLPILESCLGFNADMLSLITALYILFDPVITSANVLGNGAFAKGIDKLLSYQTRKSLVSVECIKQEQ